MKKIITYIAVLLIVACAREDRVIPSAVFGYRVEQLSPPLTKSAYIADDFNDSKITGITVAVYDHNTGALHYRKHFTSGFDNMEIMLRDGTAYDLYALANMGDRTGDLPADRNVLLSDYSYTVPSYADVNEKGLPMTGMIENYVAGSGDEGTFDLKRLFARVTLNVNTGYDGGTVDGVRVVNLKICNANAVLSAFGISKLLSASDRLPVEDYATNSTVNASSIVFYIPENRQGTIGSAITSRDKNPDSSGEIDAVKDLLTYVDVTVSANSSYYTGMVHYRSYVGADPTTDFNVVGNNCYVWNMSLTEDGLVYDDWKIGQDLTDARYLHFVQDTCLVEPGDTILWEDILETNMLWGGISRTYSGSLLYVSVPDETGFTVRNDVVEGSTMKSVFGPSNNWRPALEDTASFVVVSRYLFFDRDTFPVNPRKTVSSHIEYGNTYSGAEVGLGGFSSGTGIKWIVIPPESLPHSGDETNRLDYSYDSSTDSVSWTPTRYAAPGDYPLVCSTTDGRHTDMAVLHINDTRWLNTQAAYSGLPRETSIARAGIGASTVWNIGYAFGDLSVSDDQSMTSQSPNYGYYAGNSITGEWNDHIGYSLVGQASEYLNQRGVATSTSNTYSLSQDIPLGDYVYRIYWKNTWSEALQDYAVRDSAVLHVTGTYISGITVSPTTLNITAGETANLSARISNSGASFKKVSWLVVSGEGCVSVVSSGDLNAVVTGLVAGTATVRAVAMDGSGVQSNICTITVTNPPVNLTVIPSQATIYMGTTLAYSAIATFADGSEEDVTNSCRWNSSARRVAAINQTTGVATAGTESGVSTITASYTANRVTVSGTATLTVIERPIASSIEYLGSSQYILYNTDGSNFNNQYNLSSLPLKINYADGTSITGTLGTLGGTLSAEGATSITASGTRVTALAKGVATVVITCDGQQTSFDVYVSEIRVNPVSAVIMSTLSPYIYCYITPYDTDVEVPCEVSWSSERPDVATVTSAYGTSTRVRKVYNGYYLLDIYAAYDGAYGKCTLTVPCTIYGSGGSTYRYLEVQPETVTLNPGGSIQLVAKYHTVTSGVDDGGVAVSATWGISSGTGLVDVSSDGMVTAIAGGTARVSAFYSGASAYATIIVSDNPPVITHYLEIVPQTASLEVGATLHFEAIYHTVTNGIDDGGQNVTPSWTSSNNSVVSISTDGTATARGRGTATITANFSAGGEIYTSTSTVTVAQQIVEVYRLAITPAETTIAEGGTLTYVVHKYTDIYSDGVLTYEDLTGVVIPNTDVNWSVTSGGQYASVNASGVVSGITPGDATVRATYKNDSSVTTTAVIHVDTVFNVDPGTGEPGSGGGNY